MDNDGLDSSSFQARREDEMIPSKAILGHDLNEIYSNQRIIIAVNRNKVEGLAWTDVSEMFSPARVTQVCEKYGLKP